jgi:hypothetical protein
MENLKDVLEFLRLFPFYQMLTLILILFVFLKWGDFKIWIDKCCNNIFSNTRSNMKLCNSLDFLYKKIVIIERKLEDLEKNLKK